MVHAHFMGKENHFVYTTFVIRTTLRIQITIPVVRIRILLHNYAHSVAAPDLHQIKKMQTKNIVFFLLFNQQQFSVQTKGRILLQCLNSDSDPARLIRIGNTEQNCAGLIIKLQACGLPAPPCLGERIEFSIISTHHIRLQEVACATMNKR